LVRSITPCDVLKYIDEGAYGLVFLQISILYVYKTRWFSAEHAVPDYEI